MQYPGRPNNPCLIPCSHPQMRQYVAKAPDDMIGDRTGQEAQMQVTLRDVEPFSLWVSFGVRECHDFRRGMGQHCKNAAMLARVRLMSCTFHCAAVDGDVRGAVGGGGGDGGGGAQVPGSWSAGWAASTA